MCEFCENKKNLSATYGIIKIEKSKYSSSGYILVADNSGGEYGEVYCNINFCPICGRKLTDDEQNAEEKWNLEICRYNRNGICHNDKIGFVFGGF